MKRILMILLMLVIAVPQVYSQGFLKKLGESAKKTAEEAIERNVNKKVENKVDKTFEGNQKTQSDTAETAKTQTSAQTKKTVEATYAKCDFVAGDEIIFDDPMVNEQMGEFPSQWDLLNGNAEVASMNGLKCINLEAGTDATIAPLMKDMKNYLPDVFTVEFDYWINSFTETNEPPSQKYTLEFFNAEGDNVMEFTFGEGYLLWYYTSGSGDRRDGSSYDFKEVINAWSHLSVSFNKRAFKAYINGSRVINIPNMAVPASLTIKNSGWADHRTLVTNFRIAKGAVPLYDRMMSEGKFITYGITFDVGKSTIKPESMGEITRIVKLMTENPDLKFSVEGHTDNTGNANSNQTLSDARSKAIVDKLVDSGIASGRLKSVGKGQNSPIADNSTEEGRAKNRRVEFVKY